MIDLMSINKKISNILKRENNGVVYTVWLSCTENAKLERNNIVIDLPNHYLKETFEDKYKFEVESLYRNEFDFFGFIVRSAQ